MGQINKMIEDIENAPSALDPIMSIVDDAYTNITAYSGLPWIEDTRNHVRRYKYFLEDMRADVLEFVNVSHFYLVVIFHHYYYHYFNHYYYHYSTTIITTISTTVTPFFTTII